MPYQGLLLKELQWIRINRYLETHPKLVLTYLSSLIPVFS